MSSKPLSQKQIPELEDMIQETVGKAVTCGKAWAEAKALYESIDDKKEVILGGLIAKQVDCKSNEAKKNAAYLEKDWETYLGGLSEARGKCYQAIVDYDMAKLKIEVLRSVLSTRREELSKLDAYHK